MNADATQWVAEATSDQRPGLICVGTDCVFDGNMTTPYREAEALFCLAAGEARGVFEFVNPGKAEWLDADRALPRRAERSHLAMS